MAIDLKFSKSDTSSSWGFRVVGGAEFQQPLVVVKVTENSLAEIAGLKVGDIIDNISDISTSILTHSEIQQAISSAGAQFILGVKRGEYVPPELLQDEGRDIEVLMRDVQVSVDEEIIEKAEQLVEHLEKEVFAEFGKHKATKSTSQQAENKMVFSNSTQTYFATEDKYKQKKWSTFLMKPNRPLLQPSKPLKQEQEKPNSYKIVIQKQSRRKALPKEKRVQFDQNISEIEISNEDVFTPELPISPNPDSLRSQPDPDSLEEASNENENITNNNDSDQEEERRSNPDSDETSECQYDEMDNYEDDRSFEGLRKDSLGMGIKFKPISEIIVDPDSEITMTLEEQLRSVQKQLEALSLLPSAVQITLDAVSKQLAEIVSAEENENDKDNDNGNIDQEIVNEDQADEASASIEVAEAESGECTNSVVGDDLEEDSITEDELRAILERVELEEEREAVELENLKNIEDSNRIKEEQLEAERKEEELLAKKEKEMADNPKHTFRPIVLPGGRKWIDPDDVVPTRKPKMTDEKIMESIESSLEVIAGNRKGINFMKYTPPQKNLDHLQRSDVYRLIHGMEPPTRGIVTRPEKSLPEEDYYEATRDNF